MLNRLVSRIKQRTGITRSKAWRLYSDEYLGDELSICYVGSEIQKNFIKKALFPKAGAEQYLGVQLFYRLSPIFLKRNFELTVAEKLSDEQLPTIEEQHWELPFWVHCYADIPLEKLSSSFKSDLRLIRRHEFSYRVTSDEEEIRDFYQKMYLPLVRQSHGESSIAMHLDELLGTVARGLGELLLVLRNDLPVSGMVIDYRERAPNLWSVGVLEADRNLLSIAAIPASYHFCYLHLLDSGYSRVSLGLCRAFINDGVLKFKQKFRPKLLNATDRTFLLIPRGASRALAQLLSENAFINTTNGRLGLATFVADAVDVDTIQASISKRFADLELARSEVYAVLDGQISKISTVDFAQHHALERTLSPPGVSERDEVARAARYLLRHLLNLRNERSMLLYGDELSDSEGMEAIEAAAREMGLEVDRLLLNQELGHAAQSQQIEARLGGRDYDVICEASGQYFYNTPSWRLAHRKGARTFGLGPLDVQSLIDCVGRVDHHKVFFLAERVSQILRRSSFIQLTDSNGTDLRVRFRRPLSNQVMSKLKLARPCHSIVHQPTGFLSSQVSSTFLGGQLSFLGYLPDTNGRIVLDSFLWPPKELGPLDELVTLEIRQGRIVDIEGGGAAQLFAQHQPVAERGLEHICIGLNPGASIRKNLMEAERAYGACNFGFGVFPYHTDGVVSKPTLLVDDVVIIENGVVSVDI